MKSRLLAVLAILAMIAAACGGGDDTTDTTADGGEDTATTEAEDMTDTTEGEDMTDTTEAEDGGGEMSMPGEGVTLNMGRADWSSGYFQAYVYEAVLEELGYDVTDPSDTELGPSLAYLGMAQGDFDFWTNSWYPGHLSWHEAELPDGSTVGDHLEIVGTVFDGGGIQGWLIEKEFADKYDIKTMEDFNNNPDAIAEYDASDPSPGNGIADIYGCQESFTCDNMIQNMIAYGEWDNIQQAVAGYDTMFAEAEDKVGDGLPIIIYTWTPTSYVARLIPGQNVYWLGTETVLDDSNPADQDGGADHQQREGPTGIDSFVPIPPEQCPAAAEEGIIDDAMRTDDDGGMCPMGWIPATITPTANADVLNANPALRAVLENLSLPVVDVSLATVDAEAQGGTEDAFRSLAADWVAENRDRVDPALEAARAAAGG
jgi:glycine betaine/proline transport system substrate-binding protein